MASRDTIEMLRRCPIIGLLDANALKVLANVADIRPLVAGEVLFSKGDRSDGGYAVLGGQIAVGPDGEGEDAQLFGPGSLIGQVALFLRMQRPATAVAQGDATVLRISPTLMKRVLEEYPEAVEPIRRAMARNLGELTGKLEEVHARLAAMDVG